MEKNIYFPSFGTSCGFANSAFQFLFTTHLKKLFPVNIILGQLQQNTLPSAALFPVELFDIHNYGLSIQPDARVDELSMDRLNGFNEDISKINAFVHGTDFKTLEINGYFQYHTALMSRSGLRETFDEIYTSHSNDNANITKFQQILRANQQSFDYYFKDKTFIVCHIRLGDYKVWEVHDKGGIFFTNDIQLLVQTIKEFIDYNYIQNAEIYLASDGVEECLPYFQEKGFNPITAQTLFPDISADSGTALMLDMTAISMADVFFASNSSFSIFGALLNTKTPQCFRPSPVDKSMVGFLPWNTQVLYKQSDTYPCSL